MANPEHEAQLKRSVKAWNQWRKQNPDVEPDLSEVILFWKDLSHANLSKANLSYADLRGVNLSRAYLGWASLEGSNLNKANLSRARLHDAKLHDAKLHGADLSHANLESVDLYGADLRGANLIAAQLWKAVLSYADLRGADLSKANLSKATLSQAKVERATLVDANLQEANLVRTNFQGADLTGARIYGISVWDVKTDEKTLQKDLVITTYDQPTVTVDNLKVAQFIYLMLDKREIRDAIDTIISKVVLILGRFGERKPILDAIRDKVRHLGYTPVMFDFTRPRSRTFIETVSALAHLARFVIADFTDPKIVNQEVPHIAGNLAIPIQPLFDAGSGHEAIVTYDESIGRTYILPTRVYKSQNELIDTLEQEVVRPALKKAAELDLERAQKHPLITDEPPTNE